MAGHVAARILPLALAASIFSSQVSALTPPRRDKDPIGRFMIASLQTMIFGEFGGRGPSSRAYPMPPRPICGPHDYADLAAAAGSQVASDAFHRRCQLIEVRKNDTQVIATAYLPASYCETLRHAYNDMLNRHVYGVTDESEKSWVRLEFKGARYEANDGHVARSAPLQTVCNADGSLSVSAPRKRK